ncbi:MAG: hypothetical protein JNM39_16260 [Bdellovibrionaceae bacterium]|nr:hypothetical protein [Pseudobdellovibrionaceae bacterium]
MASINKHQRHESHSKGRPEVRGARNAHPLKKASGSSDYHDTSLDHDRSHSNGHVFEGGGVVGLPAGVSGGSSEWDKL